jgi:hypothetical protein
MPQLPPPSITIKKEKIYKFKSFFSSSPSSFMGLGFELRACRL